MSPKTKVGKSITPKEIKERYEKLVGLLSNYQYRYHTIDNPEISDEAYDSLLSELVSLEEKYPDIKSDVSPSLRVGGEPIDAFKKVTHRIRQWSYDNVFTEEELLKWEERIERYYKKESSGGNATFSYVCEHKIDGLKIVLTYKNGILVEGATRGDGIQGEDITQNLKTIESIPLLLRKKVDIVVVGEAWLPHREFERINKERKKQGEELYANPRNVAAGTLRQLDPKVVSGRKLDSFIYEIDFFDKNKEDLEQPRTQVEKLKLLQTLGFKVNKNFIHAKSIKEVIQYYNIWKSKRDSEDFEMDGVVVKVNEQEAQEVLGHTGKAPRFAIAFKFPAEQATTVIEGIAFQVGRTGVITPVAHLKPVLIAGSVVSRATLHNEDQIKRLDIRIGDTVVLQKAGDVIPEILSVVTDLRSGKEKVFKFPKKVAGCGGDGSIERIKGQSAYRCVDKNSFAQKARRFHYFVSKKAFNIEGLGPRIIDLFLEKGLIDTYDDIFTLTAGDIIDLPGFKDKLASNLIEEIADAREVSLARFLIALSIDQVGEETAHDLAEHFQNIKDIEKASFEELDKISGIGDVVARSVHDWFSSPENKKVVRNLLKHVKIQHQKQTVGIFLDKTFVVTGTLSDFSREEVKEVIRKECGAISSSVSQKTDYLLAGKEPGSKFGKAKGLGVTILNEEKFKSMFPKK